MARKKKEESMPAMAEPKLKPVRLDLNPDEHKLLRIKAAEADMSMAAFARKTLVETLKKGGGK
jgi:hypothetical protein